MVLLIELVCPFAYRLVANDETARSLHASGTICRMSVTKWTSSDPEIGSPVFPEYADPAMAHLVVHFVGRQRGGQLLPLDVRAMSTEERFANILQSKMLRGFSVPRANGARVVCLSDLSSAELEAAFHRGLNTRGAVDPWAVVFFRVPTWELGFRPVMYVERDKIYNQHAALMAMYGSGWDALAVPTDMRSTMPREDWTSEREWRYCFPAGTDVPLLGIEHGVAAVIVGRSGWVPPYPVQLPPAVLPPERWLWDADKKQLVRNGRVAVWVP